jgi:hypothetical protein
MNQVAQNQMRLYDLPSKLLCRVLNVELKVRPLSPPPISSHVPCEFPQAEQDTDEVYAQIMLMPEPEVSSLLLQHYVLRLAALGDFSFLFLVR